MTNVMSCFRRRQWCWLLAIFLCVHATAEADSFNIKINTQTIAGTGGLLNFQFLPANIDAPPATIAINAFSATNATLGNAFAAGDVAGALPGAVIIKNTFQLNEVAQDFVYGGDLSFNVALTHDGSSGASSSEFSLYLLGLGQTPGEFEPLLTTDLDGKLLSIILNADGNSSYETFGIDSSIVSITPDAIPEPATILLLSAGLTAGAFGKRRRKQ